MNPDAPATRYVFASRAYTADPFQRQAVGVLTLDSDGIVRFIGASDRSHDIAFALVDIRKADFAVSGANVAAFRLRSGVRLRLTFLDMQRIAAVVAFPGPTGFGGDPTDDQLLALPQVAGVTALDPAGWTGWQNVLRAPLGPHRGRGHQEPDLAVLTARSRTRGEQMPTSPDFGTGRP